MKNPAVENVVTFAGFDLLSGAQKTNAGVSFVTLKDWSERTDPRRTRATSRRRFGGAQRQLPRRRRDRLQPAADPGHQHHRRLRVLPAGPLRRHAGQPCRRRPTRSSRRPTSGPSCAACRRPSRTGVPQYRIDVDRDKAKALGVPITSSSTRCRARSAASTSTTSPCSAAPTASACRPRPSSATRPTTCGMSSCAPTPAPWCRSIALVTVTRIIGPDTVDRFNIFPAAKILGNPAPGFSSGQAIAAMQEVVAQDAVRRLHDRLDRLGLPGAPTAGTG